MCALSKIPILRVRSPDCTDDTRTTIRSYRPSKSRYSPRQKITPQEQQQISTKRLLITRQKSLTQIRFDHKYKSTSNYNKKVRVRISTAQSSASTSTVNTSTENSVVLEEDANGYSKEQELLNSVKVEPCVQAEGPQHVILPSGASLTKALRTKSPDCDKKLVRFVYKVPNDGYSTLPIPKRHTTPVVNLSLNNETEHSLSSMNPAPPISLIKIQLKQNSNVSARKSTNEIVPEESQMVSKVKSIKLSRVSIPREWQALRKYNTIDLFDGPSESLFSTGDDENGKNTVKSRTYKRKNYPTCTSKYQMNWNRHQSRNDDDFSINVADGNNIDENKTTQQIKFGIKSPEMDSVRKPGSKISVKVEKKSSKVSL